MRRLTLLLLASLLAVPQPSAAAPDLPALTVTRQVTGLELPWDVQPLGSGRLLITERDRRRVLLWDDGETTVVGFPSKLVWAEGETGLMSLEVDPRFSRNHRFYTCYGAFAGDGVHDVRVIAWRLRGTQAVRIRALVTGVQATSGRHGGCRLLITRNGALLVGTGDAAVGTNPQDRRSLNGKVLRLDRFTGDPWPDNPWPKAKSLHKRYLFTYGHRNVQGLAQRADGRIWSLEHGPDKDDEANLLVRGGNYGWNPVPGYNETVPMTDHSLPGVQIGARWSSGSPTLATSGAAWVYGDQWGDLDGTLAVACLKGSRLVFMRFGPRGKLLWTRAPAALQEYGRLRSVTRALNGDLLVTTSNGVDDAVLRIHPS